MSSHSRVFFNFHSVPLGARSLGRRPRAHSHALGSAPPCARRARTAASGCRHRLPPAEPEPEPPLVLGRGVEEPAPRPCGASPRRAWPAARPATWRQPSAPSTAGTRASQSPARTRRPWTLICGNWAYIGNLSPRTGRACSGQWQSR